MAKSVKDLEVSQGGSLRVERFFTRPGVDPYDEVEWEIRDAVIGSGDKIAFEQKEVEFPKSWSQNAANIVAQKYFRGPLDTPRRETSVRQMIGRVANWYTQKGLNDRYFVDGDSAEIFRSELTYLLLNQHMAFNSPVWFNVGLVEPPRVSACQPYHSLVNTPSGPIPMGRLVETNAIGEKVLDAYGVTKIEAVKHNGRKVALRIDLGSHGLEVTPDHLVWRASVASDEGGRFVPAGELRVGDLLIWVDDGRFRTLPITNIQGLGEMDVYDIQTESGEYLSEGIRVHNCFILDVEDDMRSILNWYVEEGLIFKAGSGAGVNLSKLRSSKEQLSSGGLASGPVSFMRGADASAGTIKSGGSTRRAAKMVILDTDHPDIEEFIWCKAMEERKARALRDAGFDVDLDGKDSHSLMYQNANNSVGISDEFIQAYLEDRDWELRAVSSGKVMKTVKARDLMRQIAQAAWECADPGVFYLDNINKWHTSPAAGPIRASNPCSEFLRPENSSCNLASLRLTKFLDENEEFKVDDFVSGVETTITAMDASVSNAEYPTEKIRDTVNTYRDLGIGVTDLGALLMRRGIPYDSDEGRAWAGAIIALMTGVAYRRSAEIAAVVGPYPGWSLPGNREGHLKVMEMHRSSLDEIDVNLAPQNILDAARRTWDEALELGKQYGYRNAQSSLTAPTGTISFLLDADTTGIEPDLALVKSKKLVGGGVMKIVNQAVPSALRRLGYAPEEISEIVSFISENNTVVGAPFMKEEHYQVFDCAMGSHPIHYMGHVRMLAAIQPFISGSSSKTVNMPEEVTVEDIEHVYVEAWRLGLKNLAIYRDNCKVAQPLSAEKKTKQASLISAAAPTKRKLPRTRPSKTISFEIADSKGYVHAGEYPDTGELGEIFLKVAKQGSTLAGVMDAFAIAISIGLQYGVPLKAFVEKFVNMRFEPSGVTDDPDFRFATSIVDYIFRRLAADYLSPEEREALNIWTVSERQEVIGGKVKTKEGNGHSKQVAESVELISDGRKIVDAPLCFTCGIAMQPAGSCWVCGSCGTTSGCS